MNPTFTINGLGVSSSGRYEMALDRGRRKAPRMRKAAEEAILTQRVRDRGTATIYDLLRNDPVAAWGFNKFLDYSTVHYFAAQTEDGRFNDELEAAVADWCRAKNCDVAARNDFDGLIRLFGSGLALDGDAALLKISGAKLQGIESDRLRANGDGDYPESVNGVLLDPDTGRATGYLLFNRGPGGKGYAFNRVLRPEDLIFRGNFIRFDQVRGVPMLAPAVNTFTDVKEIDEAQLMKCKNHAMMGLAITSQNGSGLGFGGAPLAVSTGGCGDSGDEEEIEETSNGIYPYDLTMATKLELEPGDTVNTIESHTPSNEYQTFAEMQLRKSLLAFGLAFSFFDSRQSSYTTMKQDRAEFKFFIQRTQRLIRSVRCEVTDWALPQIIADYGLKWSGADRIRYEWMGQAEPWLDESKEVKASIDLIGAGLSSAEREARTRGRDVYDVTRENARWQNYLRRSGVVVGIGTPGGALFNSDKMNNSDKTAPSGAEPADSPAPPAAPEGAPSDEENPNNEEGQNGNE